jgi:hypothetical protein
MFFHIFYYITDPVSSAILYINENPYLVSALNAGILDCIIKTCNDEVHHNILNLKKTGMDIKLDNNIPVITELSFELKRKKSLIELRAPAFQILIRGLELAKVNNILGFNDKTPQIILSVLNDNARILEYARIMDMTPEFALNELTMLSDSLNIDDFRIFTLSMFWQKKINACENVEDVKLLMEPISRSFWSSGIPHV